MGAACVTALGVLRAPYALAEPLGGVTVSGDCPTRAQVVGALAERRLPDTAREYRLSVHPEQGESELVLSAGAGRTALTRRIASNDCAAVAAAMAFITEAFFVELETGGAPPAPAAPSSAPPASAAFEPRPEGKQIDVRPPTARPVPTADGHVGARGPIGAPAYRRSRAEIGERNVLLTGGFGAYGYAAPAYWSGFGELGAGLYFGRSRLFFELHFVGEGAEAFGKAPDRVLRSESRLAVRVERDFGSFGSGHLVDFWDPRWPVFVAPWVGLGGSVSRSRALDLENGPVRHLLAPVAEAGVSLRYFVTAWLDLTLEAGCHFLFTRERYVVTPDGRIGEGPRFGCQLGPTVSWAGPGF